MKKFIILLMSAILLFSVFAITACGKEEESKTPTSKTTSSSEEETSSTGKLSRVFGDSSTGNSNNNPGIVSIPQGNSNAPTSVTVPSFSGDSFYVTPVPVPSGVSDDVRKLIIQINAIDSVTPSNYTAIEPTIASAESRYALLSPTEQALVTNHNQLVAAREAFNKIKAAGVWAEFEQGVTALPAPEALKNANVDAVYAMKDLMEENRASLSQNAGFSALETTLNACYQKIQSSLVEVSYIAQDGNGNGILESSVIANDGKTRDETGINEKPKKRGKDFKSVANFFNITDNLSDGSADAYHMYSDTKNITPVKIWQYTNFTTFTFTTTTPGTLTFYARPQNNRTYSFTSDAGAGSFTSGSTEASCKYEIEVSGTVTVSVSGGSGYCVAVKFSYPNLG